MNMAQFKYTAVFMIIGMMKSSQDGLEDLLLPIQNSYACEAFMTKGSDRGMPLHIQDTALQRLPCWLIQGPT